MCELARGPKLERQLTCDKWTDAEDYMEEHPEMKELLVQSIGDHVYKLVREDSVIKRIHYELGICKYCSAVDVGYTEYAALYSVVGFTCSDCATAISGH